MIKCISLDDTEGDSDHTEKTIHLQCDGMVCKKGKDTITIPLEASVVDVFRTRFND